MSNNLLNIFDAIVGWGGAAMDGWNTMRLDDLAIQAHDLGAYADGYARISETEALRVAVAIVAYRESDRSHDSHLIRKSLESEDAAAALGRRGGRAKTAAKKASAIENGKKGGRPKHYNYMQALERLSELGAIAIATNAYDMSIEDAIAQAHETSLIEECADSFNGPYVVDADSLKVWKLVNGLRESTPTCEGLTK